MTEVRIVRLRFSPEEFICEVLDQNEDNITIKNPYLMGMIAQNKLGFQAWSPLSANREFTFAMEDVLFVKEPFDVLVKDYIEQTSRIKIVSSLPSDNNVRELRG